MALPAGLRALEHRAFRRFFAAQLLAQVGTWMQTVAQSWLVLQLTGSPLLLGLLGTLQSGPVLLLSLLSGAVADRFPRRPLLIATQTTLAAQALALGLLASTGWIQYWHVAALGFLVGLAQAIDAPARQALVMGLVGRADLVNAVGLNSASFNGARIVGPAVAGILIGQLGVAPAFLLNSAGFLVVVLTLLHTPEPSPPPPRRPTTLAQEIGEGIRYAARVPRVRLILGILLVVSLCVFNFTVYVPLLARTVFHLGPEGFGFLMTALGIGAVTGALTLAARATTLPSPGLLGGAAAVACVGLLGLGLAPTAWAAVPLLCLTGCAGIVTVAGCNTALQLEAPDDLRGRVMGLYTLVYGGVYPVGSFLVGATAERWGVPVALRLAGALGLAILAALALRGSRISASRSWPRSRGAAPPG